MSSHPIKEKRICREFVENMARLFPVINSRHIGIWLISRRLDKFREFTLVLSTLVCDNHIPFSPQHLHKWHRRKKRSLAKSSRKNEKPNPYLRKNSLSSPALTGPPSASSRTGSGARHSRLF